ncbi:MAG: L-carnitine dehydratase/bile acid-inducible protein F [uncultured Chloroflexi bacterium]|uniref:L-carnitine dehydratase/bile acid-inducible protein F n=1 Tax=uncultured Chloroflexota bacterium TaxID=166587 RepID=A0A6J4K6C4_9CHLR|nr:MAG: L-carnitine dehydratase/bile acid-inducible protein F [uncultured Chloroflexota bacterium]
MLPLDGVRVLELANFMAGPYCGMLLGDLGADVVKVENPAGGDYSRGMPPFNAGEGAGFLLLNRNKRSLALDLKHPRGAELFLALADGADVVVENFRPGTMHDLGLSYETLAARNPRLIYLTASAYGQDGPYAERPGLDLILQGMSGVMSITGEPEGAPVKVGVPLCDLTAALYGAYAILAALLARQRSGEGQLIDVSLFEAGVSLAVWEAASYWTTGKVPERLGSAHRASAPYQAFRTADGHVTVGATTPNTWGAFCQVLGLDDLHEDPRFSDNAERRARHIELAGLIERVTVTRTSDHWYTALEAAGVPCGVLQSYDQVLADPHLQARSFFHELPHPTAGSVRSLGSPARLQKTPPRLRRAGPLLGEHTQEVLGELGLSAVEVEALVRERVVGVPPR